MVPTRDGRLLVWTPRLLALALIAFVSPFALDVFDGQHSLGETLLALAIHLIPTWLLIAGLALAWRRPWIGTVVYGLLGMAYIVFTVQRDMPAVSLPVKLLWCATIAGPALLVAALFWVSWQRQQHRVPSAP